MGALYAIVMFAVAWSGSVTVTEFTVIPRSIVSELRRLRHPVHKAAAGQNHVEGLQSFSAVRTDAQCVNLNGEIRPDDVKFPVVTATGTVRRGALGAIVM